jgi:hypothetical protein
LYLFGINIVLVNLLIAMMTSTYQRIEVESHKVWARQNIELVEEFTDRFGGDIEVCTCADACADGPPRHSIFSSISGGSLFLPPILYAESGRGAMPLPRSPASNGCQQFCSASVRS